MALWFNCFFKVELSEAGIGSAPQRVPAFETIADGIEPARCADEEKASQVHRLRSLGQIGSALCDVGGQYRRSM